MEAGGGGSQASPIACAKLDVERARSLCALQLLQDAGWTTRCVEKTCYSVKVVARH